jgi:hypothetical protein
MIITRVDNTDNIRYAYLNIFPDQFKSEAEKENPTWIKNTMDYFANVAYAQYRKNRDTFCKNYDLMKGIISWNDFYTRTEPEVRDFADQLLNNDEQLPEYVKHYPILNPPINTMIGELAKRPDGHRVRAFDDESRNEELEYKGNITQELILQQAHQMITMLAAQNGEELSEEEITQQTQEKVKDLLTDFTSLGEMWANHMITALKAEFNMKEKSEDAMRDLLVASREYYHIFEDTSKTGFNIEVLNPKNYWYLGTPDKKYTSGASREHGTPYANGTVHVMEISEIIDTFPELTKDEIDHLRTNLQDYGLINVRPSNLFNNQTGIDTVKYDTYNRLILQERMMIESELKENKDELLDWMGLTNSTASFGYKYTVVRAYWMSKKKIGRLIYLDEKGDVQATLVDESYKKSPNELDIEWGWVNQMYQGLRIGPDIFHIKPFNCLDYSPIIGVTYEIKNTTPKSLVDLMKPYQMIYNVAMNQLWKLLEKEIGVVYNINLRKIPTPKDADAQDAIEIWEEEARKRGIVFEDDSPENMKVPGNNTNNSRAIDLTRTSEIQSRYQLAAQMKIECWELVGMNRQRLGSSSPSETATATQSNLSQSFAQTEPWFAQHEYVLDQVYQALLDMAQYIESRKPESTISYVSNEGEAAFIRVMGSDLKLRDFKLFSTSRPEDQRLFSELRQLAQPMLQNGATPYEIVNLYSTNSIRQMKKIFKTLKEQQDERIAQEQQMKQQEIEQQNQQAQAVLAQEADEKEKDRINENFNKAEDRLNKKEVALISQLGRNPAAAVDADNSGVSDALEITKQAQSYAEVEKKYDLEMQKIAHERQKQIDDAKLAREKLQVERENMKNDIAVEKIRAKNRAKPTAKKKK